MFISLSTSRIIAENCPELRQLYIRLNTSTIPPFNTISKSLRHNLEVLVVGIVSSHPSRVMPERRIQLARYLDTIFINLKSIYVELNTWSGVHDLIKLCQDIRGVS